MKIEKNSEKIKKKNKKRTMIKRSKLNKNPVNNILTSSLRHLFLYGILCCLSISIIFLSLPHLVDQEVTEYLGYVHTCGTNIAASTNEEIENGDVLSLHGVQFVNYIRIQKTGSTFWSPILELALEEFPSESAKESFHKEWLCSSVSAHDVEDNLEQWNVKYSLNKFLKGCRYASNGSNIAVSTIRNFIKRHIYCGDNWRIVLNNGHLSYKDFKQAVNDVQYEYDNQQTLNYKSKYHIIHPVIFDPLQQVSYITLIRSPNARICSEYHHSVLIPLKDGMSKENNWVGYKCCPNGLELCTFKIWLENCPEANNRQTRMISGLTSSSFLHKGTSAGENMLQYAKDNLSYNFKAYLILEQFEDSLLLLKNIYELHKFNFIPENIAPKPSSSKHESYNEQDLLDANIANELDNELYDWALEKFNKHLDAIKQSKEKGCSFKFSVIDSGYIYSCDDKN